MAAYAALNTLMYILQQIQNHPCPPITLEKQHIDSLSEIICFLQDFLENYSHRDIGDGKEALERQIANAVYAAEDVIETHIVDQILAKSKENNFTHLFGRGAKKMIRTLACFTSHITDHQIPTVDRETSSNSIFCQDLQKVIEDMYLIKKEVIEIQEKIVGINDDQPPRPIISVYANLSGSSAVPPPKRKNSNTMVGFDEVLNQIMDRLTGHPPNRQVLPIVGMGGIDEIIKVSWLKRLLVAEGFLKPIAAKSLEVVAEEYLKDLIDRNLILVHKLGTRGKVKYCKMHDLLRDLCLREAKKDKFLWVSTEHDLDNLEGIQSQRRIIIHKGAPEEHRIDDRVLKACPSASLARSLICSVDGDRGLFHICRLVRVFNINFKYKYGWFGKLITGDLNKDKFKLVNSRYLHLNAYYKFKSNYFSSMPHLQWNLQMLLIYSHLLSAPLEIWEMSQLRYLAYHRLSMPDPPNVPLIHDGDDDYFILRNLHTLKGVENLKLSEEVMKRIPNIKKLGLSYNVFGEEGWWHDYCLKNVGLLNKLESLSIGWDFGFKQSWHIELVKNLAFPHSLKKLTLDGTGLLWEDMRMIGSLPHLQVLKLKFNSFRGPEWNPVEGEFLCLKYLLIDYCDDLVYWNANSSHFPCLEKLVLRFLHNLKEIPRDIGHISTLESIELWNCSDSAVMSAKNLLDEQVELGNQDLKFYFIGMKQVPQSLRQV